MPGTLVSQAFRALGFSGRFVTWVPGSTLEYPPEWSAQRSAQTGEGPVARLIWERGQGTRQTRRPDGHADTYARAPRWRVRLVVSYPDGSRAIRSKLTARKTEAGLLRTEANRFERLSKTGTATQQDLGHVLRLGLISKDDYLRLGGTQLDMSWDEVLSEYISSSYGRCRYFTHRNNTVRAECVVAFLLPHTLEAPPRLQTASSIHPPSPARENHRMGGEVFGWPLGSRGPTYRPLSSVWRGACASSIG